MYEKIMCASCSDRLFQRREIDLHNFRYCRGANDILVFHNVIHFFLDQDIAFVSRFQYFCVHLCRSHTLRKSAEEIVDNTIQERREDTRKRQWLVNANVSNAWHASNAEVHSRRCGLQNPSERCTHRLRARAIAWQKCGKNVRNSGHFLNAERAANSEFNKFNWRSSLGMQKFCMRSHCARMQSGRASNGYLMKVADSTYTAECLFSSFYRLSHFGRGRYVEDTSSSTARARAASQNSTNRTGTHWAIQIIGGELWLVRTKHG